MQQIKKDIWQSVWIGILVYTIIRLTNDSISKVKFWERPWETTFSELLGGMVMTFLFIKGIGFLIKKFNQRKVESAKKQIFYEVRAVFIYCLVLVNILANGLAAMTDDGLQVHDVIINNLAILQVCLLFFLYNRTNFYLEMVMEERSHQQVLLQEKTETELKYLKAQINPHFLFNALNSIYHLIDELPQKAKFLMEQFSGMLRYQLYECNQKMVSLDKELIYIRNYIQLEKERKTEHLDFKLTIEEPKSKEYIAPFILQPLIENAFKFVHPIQSLIHISFHVQEEFLTLKIKNSIIESLSKQKSKGGIGLQNLKRRLNLLYPEQYELLIDDTGSIYKVQLQLKRIKNLD